MKIGAVRGSLLCILVGLLAATSLAASAALPSRQGALGLSDAKFWGEASALEERAMEPFEDSDSVGLFLDGPKRVRLREHDDVPLVGVRASSLRENSTISLRQRSVLVTTRLEGDETLAALAFRQPSKSSRHNKLREPEPPDDPASLPEGRTVKAFRLALNDRIPEVAIRSGTWATTFLLFNQRSNQVVSRVDAKPGRKLQPSGQPADPPPSHPRIDAANHPFRARPDSAALAGNQPIALASATTVEQAPGKAWLLRGSFLLPALARDLASARPGNTASDAKTVAVLPVTIVLTGDRDATPILVDLRVPIHQPLERGQGQQRARGYFAVDLLALTGEQLSPQTYAVWAVSRQHLSEPMVVRITQP